MEQENAYPAALEMADVNKIEGTTMEMRTDEGSKVVSVEKVSVHETLKEKMQPNREPPME